MAWRTLVLCAGGGDGVRPATDVVLVSVEPAATLKRAYPNYFLDTSVFLDTVREAVA